MGGLLAYFRPHIRRMTLGLSIKFIGTMMDLVLPWLLAYMIDDIMPTGDVRGIYTYGLLMVLCALIAVTFNVGANRMAARQSSKFTQKLRYDLFEHVLYLHAQQKDHFSIASLVSRLTNDTYHIHQLVDKMQRLGVRAPLLVLGGSIFAFMLDKRLALVLLCIVPPLVFVIVWVSKKGVPLYTAVQKSADSLVRIVRENAMGVRVIKALSKTEAESARFGGANDAVMDAEKRAGQVMAVTNPVMSLLLNMGFMLVILTGAFLVNDGRTEPGKIMAFLSYFTIILNAVLSVNKMFVIWSRGSASAKRIVEVLETKSIQQLSPADVSDARAHIACKGVSFSYTGVQDALCDVSFSIAQGQTLGIIGATGSGKTTLINLLMRFYEPRAGEIRLNGALLGSIAPVEVRRHFGAVFQNDMLLAESVYENISFLRDIPLEEVKRAARVAQIADFIESLQAGYDTPLLVRGANLSGGQKQRLLIARALCARPEILVLDDAQSALDYKTEAALRKAIQEEYAGTTMVIVSQRVSAIRSADHILLLEEGRVEGSGTHETLMQACESYRRIVQVQMGGGQA